MPHAARRHGFTFGGQRRDFVLQARHLQLIVVVIHKQAETLFVRQIALLDFLFYFHLYALQVGKRVLRKLYLLRKQFAVNVVQLANTLLRLCNNRIDFGDKIFVVTVERCGHRVTFVYLVQHHRCAKHNVGTYEVASFAVTRNDVAALGN